MKPCIVCKKESDGRLPEYEEYPLCKDCFIWNTHKALDRIKELEAEVERLKKEAVLASLFMDGQKDQIDQLRQALEDLIGKYIGLQAAYNLHCPAESRVSPYLNSAVKDAQVALRDSPSEEGP
jgi:HEAT repeat protein